ncbi:phosphopantetheine-binding protein [Hoyosella sp. YIM 151337]|uniref:acyl carrier protein n=1 Tax=Hoyosella sp. YIM 151337 TaxID=2992742 RepID=UPI002235885A|nr:phosphopantetheine-binding protein [Hoyosella sp. YIM 151337]MCW4354240.1 phosphopantetheine-binding protein [Hoyosella sp. YIM 151337]
MSENPVRNDSGTVDESEVFDAITSMLADMLEVFDVDPNEITRGTEFHDDLEMESIDLVALSGQLRERWGEQVNFAQFIAGMELEQIMHVTVGQLVDFVVDSLNAPAPAVGEQP